MGFGILFIGYFFLLNIAYYSYTDAIAAVIMMLALYKLSGINRGFMRATWTALALTLLSCITFGIEVYSSFASIGAIDTVHTVTSLLRSAALLILHVFMLDGIHEVAREVKLREIALRSRILFYAAITLYSLNILLAIPALALIIPSVALAVASVITILGTLTLTVCVLVEIYRCYMRIYMPGTDEIDEEKPSRFEFVNKFRAHEAERAREYAEYRLGKQMKKLEKEKKNGTKTGKR